MYYESLPCVYASYTNQSTGELRQTVVLHYFHNQFVSLTDKIKPIRLEFVHQRN